MPEIIPLGKVGSSDIIGILPDGKFLAIECKSDKGRLSEAQKIFLKKIDDMGGRLLLPVHLKI